MVDRAHKPSALSPSTTGPQPTVHSDGKKVTASLPSGDSVEVMLYGATVTSWKNNGQENMWVSSNAHMDGSKAIRGGVPVVFPVCLDRSFLFKQQ
jgi:glucose-6-phosphate 1-epimerase